MVTFFICLAILIVGFLTYSKVIERVFRVDDRPTPAVAHPDGVDYVPMKTWRIFFGSAPKYRRSGPHLRRTFRRLLGARGLPVDHLRHHSGRRRP